MCNVTIQDSNWRAKWKGSVNSGMKLLTANALLVVTSRYTICTLPLPVPVSVPVPIPGTGPAPATCYNYSAVLCIQRHVGKYALWYATGAGGVLCTEESVSYSLRSS